MNQRRATIGCQLFSRRNPRGRFSVKIRRMLLRYERFFGFLIWFQESLGKSALDQEI